MAFWNAANVAYEGDVYATAGDQTGEVAGAGMPSAGAQPSPTGIYGTAGVPGGLLGQPLAAWFWLGGLFLLATWLFQRQGGGGDVSFANIRVSAYNTLAVASMSIIGIGFLKIVAIWWAGSFGRNGATDLVTAL